MPAYRTVIRSKLEAVDLKRLVLEELLQARDLFPARHPNWARASLAQTTAQRAADRALARELERVLPETLATPVAVLAARRVAPPAGWRLGHHWKPWWMQDGERLNSSLGGACLGCPCLCRAGDN